MQHPPKVDLGGIKLVMYEFVDTVTGEKRDFTLTKTELKRLNASHNQEEFKRNDIYTAIEKKLMSIGDLNQDGKLSMTEFAKVALALREKDPESFKRHTTNRGYEDMPQYGKANEFTVADAGLVLTHMRRNHQEVTMDDVRSQNITGVSVTSVGVKR